MSNIRKHEKKIKKELDRISDYFYNNISLLKLLELICYNFKSEYCEYKPNELVCRIIEHGKRVYENTLIIINFMESNNIRKFSENEKEDLKFVALVHDIGKVYKDKNHNIYSKIIIEYLYEYFGIYDEIRRKCISKMILYHNKKNENMDIVSDLDMIIRDADLFDEKCGDSLFLLAIGQSIKTKNKIRESLNHMNYNMSDNIINIRSSKKYMDKVKVLINIPQNKYLYEHLVNKAVKKYDKLTHYHRNNFYERLPEISDEDIITFINID